MFQCIVFILLYSEIVLDFLSHPTRKLDYETGWLRGSLQIESSGNKLVQPSSETEAVIVLILKVTSAWAGIMRSARFGWLCQSKSVDTNSQSPVKFH